MTTIIDRSPEELRRRRAALLERVGMEWEQLSELADESLLDGTERNIYETIRSIDYLLGADDER
jgi:hypothetical protein